MATRHFTDPLSMDVTDDLTRVDAIMTSILKDRGIWHEFLQDPNGVFVRLGLHPPTTHEINDRVNRIFYATLTNTKLLRILLKHYGDFRPRQLKKFRDTYVAGLKSGVLAHDLALDFEGMRHLLTAPATLRKVLKITLHHLNSRRLLASRHKTKEIDAYVDSVIEAVTERKPLEDHPKLEVWDRNYGIGKAFGGLVAEVPAIVTSVVSVEATSFVTAIAFAHTEIAVFVDVVVDGDGTATAIAIRSAAAAGDSDSIRAAALLGRLMDLSGELLVHAHNFEKGRLS